MTRVTRWIERHAGAFILCGLIGLFSLGGQAYRQQDALGRQQNAMRVEHRQLISSLTRSVHNNCMVLTFAIDTTKGALTSQRAESKKILPKINFPGLTHHQLVQLTEAKAKAEESYLVKFTKLAKIVCRG